MDAPRNFPKTERESARAGGGGPRDSGVPTFLMMPALLSAFSFLGVTLMILQHTALIGRATPLQNGARALMASSAFGAQLKVKKTTTKRKSWMDEPESDLLNLSSMDANDLDGLKPVGCFGVLLDPNKHHFSRERHPGSTAVFACIPLHPFAEKFLVELGIELAQLHPSMVLVVLREDPLVLLLSHFFILDHQAKAAPDRSIPGLL